LDLIRPILLAGILLSGAISVPLLAADPIARDKLPDTTPPGKPHFDSKGAKAGDQLPNIPMIGLDGKSTSLGKAWADGATLLLTSSHTCPKSRLTYPQAADLARRIAGRGVKVAIIYVIEAHPAGDPSPYSGKEEITDENRRDHILCRQPNTVEERVALALKFAERLKITVPIYVDAMDNAAWYQLGGGPNMGVLVNSDGIVLARQGWFDAKSMEQAIGQFISASPTDQGPAKPDKAAEDVEYTLFQLIQSNRVEAIKTILDQQPEFTRRPLHSFMRRSLIQAAAESGHVEVVKLLVDLGADVNQQSGELGTSLHLAAERGDLPMVQFLIEHGANVNANKDHGSGPAPLQVALFNKKPDIVDALIAAGAKPNFYTASATGDLATLRRGFLEDATILSRPDGQGRSALAYAAVSGQLASAQLLISLGAKDYSDDPYHRTAVYWALRERNLKMTRILLESGADPNLLSAATDSDVSIDFARLLLKYKADPNYAETNGLRPLHYAAYWERQDIAQLLLDAGADIDGVTTERTGLMCGPSYGKGDTPLMVAAENTRPAAVRFLVDHGAKLNVRNEVGETALHLAVRVAIDRKEGLDLVTLLIDHHADLNATDKEGQAPLDYTVRSRRISGPLTVEPAQDPLGADDQTRNAVVELLKRHGAVKAHPN